MSERTGPFEELDWPPRLRAQAVEPGSPPRLHGYDVEGDLARHYGLTESMLLGLTGEAPTRPQGRAFEIALVFACACPINEAPTHATVLARSMGAPVGGAIAAGFVAACERARGLVEAHAELLAWLGASATDLDAPPPQSACATEPSEQESVATLRRVLHDAQASAFAPPAELGRDAAILTTLWRCGLQSPDGLIVALAWATVVSTGAEGVAANRGGLTNFPALLPRFRYEAPRDE